MQGKMKWKTAAAMVLLTAVAGAAGSDQFVRQQAYAEMQRVSGQIEVIEANLGELSERVEAAGRTRGDVDALKAEVAGLRAEVASLRSELAQQREAIVKDLMQRISKLQTSAPRSTVAEYTGPVKEYEVVAGDTLSLIAQAFGTSVAKLKAMNALKSDNLRIGQKLRVPAK